MVAPLLVVLGVIWAQACCLAQARALSGRSTAAASCGCQQYGPQEAGVLSVCGPRAGMGGNETHLRVHSIW